MSPNQDRLYTRSGNRRSRCAPRDGPGGDDRGPAELLPRHHRRERRTADMVRKVANQEGRHVALMGDLQGPKIRIGKLPAGVLLVKDDEVTLAVEPTGASQREIPFPHPEIIEDVEPGDRLLLDDGALELVATAIAPNRLTCRVVVGGLLTHARASICPVSTCISKR